MSVVRVFNYSVHLQNSMKPHQSLLQLEIESKIALCKNFSLMSKLYIPSTINTRMNFELLLFWGSTVNSRFKKVHFSFLKSRVVWFKKDLCSESKNRSSEKYTLCMWICNLRSFLNRESTVLCGVKKGLEISSYFCGLLSIYELYIKWYQYYLS